MKIKNTLGFLRHEIFYPIHPYVFIYIVRAYKTLLAVRRTEITLSILHCTIYSVSSQLLSRTKRSQQRTPMYYILCIYDLVVAMEHTIVNS